MSTQRSRVRRNVARAVTTGVAVVAACCGGVAPAAADTTVPVPYTVYPDDAGVTAGAVTAVTVNLHEFGEPAIAVADFGMDSARDDGSSGSATCTMYLTRPHATPRSPRNGDIYVEGDAHAECVSARVDINFAVGIEWRIKSNYGNAGPHYQQGPSTSCSGSSRCPRSGDLITPWGWNSRCNEGGEYEATTVVLSGSYTYRNKRYDLGGIRSAPISGRYGTLC